MTFNEENNLISEISRLSGVPIETVKSVINLQIVGLMRDLAAKGSSNTFLGRVTLQNDQVLLVSPNHRLKDFTNRKKMVERIMSELPNDL